MAKISVRYLVDDVDEAINFYCDQLGFAVQMHPGPGFAALVRGELRLLLNATGSEGGASQPMPDGQVPAPGGWNRIQVEVADLGATIGALRSSGAQFRNDVVEGRGGRQVLLEDPSGNLVELFEPSSQP